MDRFSFKTILKPTVAKLTEKNSRFIAYAFTVSNEEEIQSELSKLQEEHPKASHHCYAYRLGLTKNNYRANDDGEPSGSAGNPILGQIDSFELTNTFIVVVRYYGGVNLGVSGLIKAYKQSAQLALQEAQIIIQHIQTKIKLTVLYAKVNDFQAWVNQQQISIKDEEYSNTSAIYTLQFDEQLLLEFKEKLNKFGELEKI